MEIILPDFFGWRFLQKAFPVLFLELSVYFVEKLYEGLKKRRKICGPQWDRGNNIELGKKKTKQK